MNRSSLENEMNEPGIDGLFYLFGLLNVKSGFTRIEKIASLFLWSPLCSPDRVM
jgi:hypothetical protein